MRQVSGRRAEYEYIVLGAGPAGLQLSYFLKRSGREHLVLEAGAAPGEFFRTMPRHRRLLSINKVHTGRIDPEVNLRWDWNSLLGDPPCRFGDFTAEYFPDAGTMVEYLAAYADLHNLPIEYRTEVTGVTRPGLFLVTTAEGRHLTCRRLIVATGAHRMYVPAIPGIELAERYETMPVDPESFVDQRVLIVGKGNSGFETAENLISTTALLHILSPEPIEFAWQTHFPGHLRAVNNNLLDTYQLKSQNAVVDATIDSIVRDGDEYVVSVRYAHADGEREDLRYDRVLICTGFRFDDSVFGADCRPDLGDGGRLPAQTPAWESVNVPDLYFAGFLMADRDYQKASSSFIHGFRYNIRALVRMLDGRHHGVRWPSRRLDAGPEALAASLLERVNRTSALWIRTRMSRRWPTSFVAAGLSAPTMA